MTIEHEARQLMVSFIILPSECNGATANLKGHEGVEIAKRCSIIHVEKLREHTKKITDALSMLDISADDEYYTNLINAIKNL